MSKWQNALQPDKVISEELKVQYRVPKRCADDKPWPAQIDSCCKRVSLSLMLCLLITRIILSN
jgi:hypothetical protein